MNDQFLVVHATSSFTVSSSHKPLSKGSRVMKRVLVVVALLATSLASVLPSASPVAATAPTVLEVVGVPASFGTNAAGFCAITQTGSNKELYCWGVNFSGRFGFGNSDSRSYPTKVAANPTSGFTNTNVTAVAVGGGSMCAIESGVIFCSGTNTSNQLGDGTSVSKTVMTKVANNTVASPPVINSGFSKVAVTSAGACALKQSMMYCWGNDQYGLMADGGITGGSNVPVMAADATPFINGAITEIGMSGKHGCLLRDMGQANDRKIYCWGMTVKSAVGGAPTYDINNNLLAPTLVPSAGDFTNGNVSTFALGEENTCVVDSGVVRCFGANNGGISSPGGSPGPVWPPVAIPNTSDFTNTGVTKVVNGSTSACALKSSALYCWGSDFSGTLGDGGTANAGQSAVKVAAANGFTNTAVTSFALAGQTACAVDSGDLYCWGAWGSQVVGLTANGLTTDSFAPTAVVWPVAPTLTSSPGTVSPSGGSLTVTGTGFTGTSSVDIGGTTATFTVTNDGSINITVPALSAGSYTITITTPGGVITQALTIGSAPTTTVGSGPTTTVGSGPTTTVAVGVNAPQLVNSSNQSQLTQTPGAVTVIVNGSPVSATINTVGATAATAAATPPAQRTPTQIAEIQAAGAALLTAFQTSLPQGATSNVSVSNTATGAVMRGLAQDASGNAVDVPVEDVLLLTTSSSALLLAGVNAANAAASLSATGVLEIGPGGIINVAGSGLPASGAAELVVMSTPRLLKSFTAGADGTFADRAALPSDLAAGNHTVVLAGSGIYMAVGITVEAATLPTTGSSSSGLALMALLVMVLAVVVVRSRRITLLPR